MISRVQYGNVRIDEARILKYSTTPVYEANSNRVFNRHVFDIEGTIARRLNSYRLDGQVLNPRPELAPNQNTTATDSFVAIEQALKTPRQHLKVMLGPDNNILFECPEFESDFETDATGGPTPLEVSVTEIVGAAFFAVRFVIQADVVGPHDFTNGQQPSALISHTWTEECQLDPQWYVVRRVSGKSLFRQDMLVDADGQWYPDQFRSWLFHPLIPGFRRTQIHVVVGPASNELQYEFTDEQVDNQLADLKVSKIEAHDLVNNATPSNEQFGIQLTEGVLQLAQVGASFFFGGGADAAETGPGSHQPSALSVIGNKLGNLQHATGVIGHLRNILPHGSRTYVVKVWGTPEANVQDLMQAAFRVIRARFVTPLGHNRADLERRTAQEGWPPILIPFLEVANKPGLSASVAATVSPRPFVEVNLTYELPLGQAYLDSERLAVWDPTILNNIKSMDHVTRFRDGSTAGPKNSRGTSKLGTLLAQELESPFGPRHKPVNLGLKPDLTP